MNKDLNKATSNLKKQYIKSVKTIIKDTLDECIDNAFESFETVGSGKIQCMINSVVENIRINLYNEFDIEDSMGMVIAKITAGSLGGMPGPEIDINNEE